MKALSILVIAALLFSIFTSIFTLDYEDSQNRSYGFLRSLKQEIQVNTNLSSDELRIASMINGSKIYQYDLELEEIALNHQAFRSGGSVGANETANWILEKFRDFGLEAYNESFEFVNWNLMNKPILIIDEDGNPSTMEDQIDISSFISDHLSWPTPSTGVFADLAVLPLPIANDPGEIGVNPINSVLWSSIDTTGKILLIGKEVAWDNDWYQTLLEKISSQTPATIVFTWWYEWMSFTPPMTSSGGGRPLGGAHYWNLEIPVGWANYQEGLSIRNMESSLNVSAKVRIVSEIGFGAHYNVIGKIAGYGEPEKCIIVSSHLDTVMCSGFCDNGAGIAGVIELARVFSEAISQGWYVPKYSILFIAFTDEEFGLVGSINYLIKHKSEIGNVIAVINMDCIGSDEFRVSETNPDPDTGLDLDEVVLNAAQDLGIAAALTEPGGSDQEAFRNPSWANGFYSYIWGLDAGISDVPSIEPSLLLISYPLLYRDHWEMGEPGWIHTSYDNSTSSATLSWIEEEDLENHVKIALLTLLRLAIPGDINDDGIVELADFFLASEAFGSYPHHPNWNPNTDINGDGIVELTDFFIISQHFGEHW